MDLQIRLGDALPPEHLARFIVEIIALLDLSRIYAHYSELGAQRYAPEVLLACWLRVCDGGVHYAQD